MFPLRALSWWLVAVMMTSWVGRTPAQTAGLPTPANRDAAATVVVYNEADQDSRALATFYAEKRSIPKENVVGLVCSQNEEISREEFERTLAEPLRRHFSEKQWWVLREKTDPRGPVAQNRMRFMALMRGVPLKIAATTQPWPGDKVDPNSPVGQQNAAAVDSELALLGVRAKPISGAINNVYFRSLTPIHDSGRLEMMLVCRLDGPSPEVVRRMITESLAAERTGLQGLAYLDARGLGQDQPGLIEGDQWILGSAVEAQRMGLPVILDNGPVTFPDGYPMRHAALYLGWYAENVTGPFLEPAFRLEPGAVAVHIHSFSASTVRDPVRFWAGPLLQRGAAATLGNVYEPYLALTPHLNAFTERLRLGFTLAEAAYMSTRVLSWMTTVIGDPLYRPYQSVTADPPKPEWAAYRQAAQSWNQDAAKATTALQKAARELKSGLLWEALALLQMGASERDGALASLKEARGAYKDRADVLRVVIHEVMQLRAAGKEAEINKLVKAEAAKTPGAPAVGVLRMIAPGAFVVPKRR